MVGRGTPVFQNFLLFINKSFNFKIGSFEISPNYWQAVAIIFLLFLLLLVLARVRHEYVHWSMKTNWSMLFMGFLLAVVIEGFLLLSGHTILTTLLGWKTAPKPISIALDAGRNKLMQVLGSQTQIPLQSNLKPNSSSVISDYRQLSSQEEAQVKLFICKPN